MFMLLTLPISPVIQFEDVYHVQCSVSFNQRAVTKGNIYLGQKVFEDKTCNFHWIFSSQSFIVKLNKSAQRSDCDCLKLKYESRESSYTGGRQREEEDKEVMTGCCGDAETLIWQFYIWRNVAFSTEEDDDVFEFDADEVENSTTERQGDYFTNSWQWQCVNNVGKNLQNFNPTLTPRQWLQLKTLSDLI